MPQRETNEPVEASGPALGGRTVFTRLMSMKSSGTEAPVAVVGGAADGGGALDCAGAGAGEAEGSPAERLSGPPPMMPAFIPTMSPAATAKTMMTMTTPTLFNDQPVGAVARGDAEV